MKERDLQEIGPALEKLLYDQREAETKEWGWDLWREIKRDRVLLLQAIEINDRISPSKYFSSNVIVDCILKDPEGIDLDILQTVINRIYDSNREAFEIAFDGKQNTFLMQTLKLRGVELTDEQRKIALDWEITQSFHGRGDIGLGYWILKNENFSEEEKKSLIERKFFHDSYWQKFINYCQEYIRNLNYLNGISVSNEELLNERDIESVKSSHYPGINIKIFEKTEEEKKFLRDIITLRYEMFPCSPTNVTDPQYQSQEQGTPRVRTRPNYYKGEI